MIFSILLLFLSNFAIGKTISVDIHFFEALAPRDTTSSERFQKEYEQSINSGKNYLKKELKDCGYEINPQAIFYNASDPLEALENAKKSEKDNAWLLVGPRRSNHYLLMIEGAKNTPTISTMASSKEVFEKGSLHLTLSPSNHEMAKAAVREVQKQLKDKKKITYISIVSSDCIACKDYAESFDTFSKKSKLEKTKTFEISGNAPDLQKITKETKELKPDVVLIPNYSKLTAQVISSFQSSQIQTLYVGSDGWGDSSFGFLQNARNLEGSVGFTTRGFPSIEKALLSFPLGKNLSNDKEFKAPTSAPGVGILKILNETKTILCKYKPKNINEFKEIFKKVGKNHFSSPWGVSIYSLKNGNISFDHLLEKL